MPTPVIGCRRISASSDGVNFFFILWPHNEFPQSISFAHLETIGCDGRHMQKPCRQRTTLRFPLAQHARDVVADFVAAPSPLLEGPSLALTATRLGGVRSSCAARRAMSALQWAWPSAHHRVGAASVNLAAVWMNADCAELPK